MMGRKPPAIAGNLGALVTVIHLCSAFHVTTYLVLTFQHKTKKKILYVFGMVGIVQFW